MSASQRRKGANGEREVCALLQAEFGVKVGRKLGQARDGGADVHMPPFIVEVKRRARIAGLYEWLKQAEDATPEGYHLPCVFLRADGQEWVVAMKFKHWATLARGELCTTPSHSREDSGLSSPAFWSASGTGGGLGAL